MHTTRRAVVIGGGPAGLMAAEALVEAGVGVDLFDAMPSVGRKFLLAGKGGLNLTHGEALPAFISRYGARAPQVARWLDALSPQALRDWAAELGIATFVGTSGRVFPQDLKAAPLLRAWLHRLRERGVAFHMRHRWLGWDDGGALRFAAPAGECRVQADATVLALGGASWPQLGSDAAWVPWLREAGIDVAPLRPANCGFEIAWSEHLRQRFAGAPIKPVVLRFAGCEPPFERQGEFVLSDYGIEGSLVYAASRWLRDAIEHDGQATITLDLLPAFDAARVAREVAHPRGSRSLSSHLKSRLGLAGAKMALLHELLPREALADPARLAAAIKALAVDADRGAADRRRHQQRRRREARSARRAVDAACAPRPLLRRRDARLGGADRRLPAAGVDGQRPGGRAGRGGVARRRLPAL